MQFRRFHAPCLGALTLALSVAVAPAEAPADPRSRTVVELFTSQGCNSCPPADRLLGQLAQRDDVIALTFNVDYWDYLGWKDTLARPENTERQRHYAHFLRSRTVYTPQIVIGGRQHAVGSDEAAVDAAIDAEQRRAGPAIVVNKQDDRLLVSIPAAADGKGEATVWLIRFENRREVPIRRGENAGHKLAYYNVVRDIRSLGEWQGQTMRIELSRDDLQLQGGDGCAIVLQQRPVGPILSAARVDLTGDSQ
ncbi:MAG: DUF1223 domain-containing protein [Alphaproteobacteria bacterium]|jgi:hypothetical protein|nr:DUF1223 domain-containing protein [Alphaproteobacteria bacterium]MDP6564490.1 DUF1223 domain-containing protein [Alphaproteobacteria bacterium]